MTESNEFVNGRNELVLRSETDVEVVRQDRTTHVTQRLVAAWISRCPVRPAQADIRKQGAAARRIVERYSVDEIALALEGIEHVAPFSMGEMWDMFKLEQRFAVAMQHGAVPRSQLKATRKRKEIADALRKANGVGLRHLRGGIPPVVREIPSRT